MHFMTWERQRTYDFEAGAQQKAVEDAEKLIKMNILSAEQIATAVNLPLKQVLELKEKVSVKI